jgi:hypothetical protein
MFLNDEYYENEQGTQVRRNEVHGIATYNYKADGFFEWECFACAKVHQTRGFKVGGVVYRCQNCHKNSLLVRTDIQYLNQIIRSVERFDTDAERAIQNSIMHLGRALTALGERNRR